MGIEVLGFGGLFAVGLLLWLLRGHKDWLRRVFNFPKIRHPSHSEIPLSVDVQSDDVYEPHAFMHISCSQRVRFLCVDDGDSIEGGSVEWTGYRQRDHLRVAVILTDSTRRVDLLANDFLPSNFSLNRCPDGYCMLPFEKIELCPAFNIGDYCIIHKKKSSRARNGGFIGKQFVFRYLLHSVEKNFKNVSDEGSMEVDDYHLMKVLPPETSVVSQRVEPISGSEIKSFCGLNKGIQGKCNSCYLDSVLFSFFAFSDIFDDVFNDFSIVNESDFVEILNIIRYQIVYPLRTHQFVSYHQVESLRKSIARQVGNDNYLTETRDIPECLEVLFNRLLKVPPLVYVGHFWQGNVQFNGAYAVEIFNDRTLSYPTSNQLLQRSAVLMQFCLKEVPKCLLLQLAREDGQKMNIFPSLRLDLKDLIYDTVKACTKCNGRADMQFWNAAPEIKDTYYCVDCATKNELNLDDGVRLQVHIEDYLNNDTELSLIGIICIERSHYNCFVRCGLVDDWIFFDSMSDQEPIYDPDTGTDEKVNIPMVKDIPRFQDWLKAAPIEFQRHASLDPFLQTLSQPDADLATRVVSYPSLLIYGKI